MKRRRRLAATLGIVALVVVDLVLVFAALRISGPSTAAEPTRSTTAVPSAVPEAPATPQGTSQTTTTAPTTSASTTTATTQPSTPGVPAGVIVSAVDGNLAWRATVGACGAGGAGLEVTTDGGKTWKKRTSPFAIVTRLQATDANKAFVVGADPGCTMGVRSTTDGGATWPGTGNLAGTLARDAKDPTKVRTAGGQTVAPCDSLAVVDLARSSATAAEALCADGSLRASTDDGLTWPAAGQVPSALALDSRPVGNAVTAYVASTATGCAGVQISAVTNAEVSKLGCAAVGAPTPGKVAVAAPAPNAAWLVVGTDTWRSTDGLKTWTKA